MTVLAIAPHPDDEAIGCGGTLSLHASRGERVACAYLTSGELGLKRLPAGRACEVREREAHAAAEVLGIAELVFLRNRDWYMGEDVAGAAARLRPVLERLAPDTIYVPHAGESHPDHGAAEAVLRAALDGRRPRLLGYEVWSPLAAWDHVEDITPVMRRKLAAIRLYESQVSQLRYDRAVRGLNIYRGITAGGCRYAEVFRVLA